MIRERQYKKQEMSASAAAPYAEKQKKQKNTLLEQADMHKQEAV